MTLVAFDAGNTGIAGQVSGDLDDNGAITGARPVDHARTLRALMPHLRDRLLKS